METKYRFLQIIMLLLGSLLMACDDESEDPVADEATEQVGDKSEPDNATVENMYFPPLGSNDWKTTSALEIGWDTASLNEAVRYAKDKNSYNLLILHKGKIVAEEYWKQTNANSGHNLESVAKSMMAFVVGVLQEDGTLKVDDKASDYLAEGWSRSPETEGEITIRHLLTMTSGLNEELKYVGRPGETWRYSHGAFKVLYDIIESATGSAYRELFDDILFSRIGMTKSSWSGKELVSPARELGKFGLMILNSGVWDGEKIIHDEGYFSDMLSTSQSIQKAYGYLWWLNGKETWYDDDNKVIVDGPIAVTMPSDSWLAKGKHDQRIYIVPGLDLVVIRQGGSTGLPESGEGSFDLEFWKRLMSAIKGDAPAP